MPGLELVASAITKAVIIRALSGTPVGALLRPAFRIYSAFDLAGVLADCSDLAVNSERLHESELCGYSAAELSESIGEEVISVSIEKGITTIFAPRMRVQAYSFAHEASWNASRSAWNGGKISSDMNISRVWNSKTRSWSDR